MSSPEPRLPRTKVARAGRILLGSAAAGLLASASAGAAVLVFPDPLFLHRVDHGRLSVLSDRPLDESACRVMLADVDARLRLSPLDTLAGRHRVVLAHAPWRQRLTFLWAYGAGGVNFYPLTRNVFLRGSDPACTHLIGPSGTPVPPPRTLAYYAAHEIAHTLTGESVGPASYHGLPIWIREGLADYIALPGQGDFAALARAYLRDEPSLDPRRSGLYARYRLLVAHRLERRGWTVARLLASNLSQDEAERELRESLGAGHGSKDP